MAKPINPYQGPAPAAISQMGQGIAQVGANIADITQRGYESMGKGLASGINAAADAYKQYKQDQAQFDATKKIAKAFENYLPEDARKKVQDIFADTTMSVSEKNKLAPMLFNIIGNAQQQAGRESVANIMAGGKLNAAEARGQKPAATQFTVGSSNDFLNLPLGGSPATPEALQPSSQPGQPASRINANGQMEVWSSRLGRYVELDNPMQDIQY